MECVLIEKRKEVSGQLFGVYGFYVYVNIIISLIETLPMYIIHAVYEMELF